MEPIIEIARNNNLNVIEDAACALGTVYKRRKVGVFGDCGAFSFHSRKAITTVEGGMLTAYSDEIAF
jgi:perosamine synthetase